MEEYKKFDKGSRISLGKYGKQDREYERVLEHPHQTQHWLNINTHCFMCDYALTTTRRLIKKIKVCVIVIEPMYEWVQGSCGQLNCPVGRFHLTAAFTVVISSVFNTN